MKKDFRLLVASALAAQALGVQAMAQDVAFGATIFADHCVACHGQLGAGDGIVGELFANRPANLRHLSKANNGVFPTERVIEAIYGRADIPGHGQSKMPIWGDYFMTEALNGPAIDPADAAMIAQGRVLSVVSYLISLQIE